MIFILEPVITSNATHNMAYAKEKKEEQVHPPGYDPTQENGGIKSTVNQNGEVSLKTIDGNENDVWTNYAEILMATAVKKDAKNKSEKKEKEKNKTIKEKISGAIQAPFNNAVNGAVGKGAVTYEEPFSKMSSDSKIIDAGKNANNPNHTESGKAGQMVASVIATYSHYNYWDSVSGNAIANGVGGKFTKFIRTISGGIAYIGIICYYLLNKLQDVIADTMININPYQLLHFSGGDNVATDNGIVKGINTFLDKIGLNGNLISAITGLGLLCIVMFYTLKIIMSMRKGNLRDGGRFWKNMFVRLFVAALLLSFLSMSATMMGSILKGLKHSTTLGSNAVLTHLYDTKTIASGTNLSPTGGVSTDRPDVGMDKNYIDTKFDPNVSREMISNANQNANWILYGTPKTTDGKKDLSYTLLDRYMEAKRFNVNDYIADLRRSPKQTGTGDYLPGVKTFPKDFKNKNENSKPENLELGMWSATQNVDKTNRYPQSSNFDPSGTTGASPGKSTGVVNDSTFSTQSVVLLLQSAFDGENAKFNAYNLGAQGEQSTMKSISTIKTEWNAVTLPGNGIIGQFASWLGMISQSITYVIISLAVVITIFTTNLILGYILFFKQCIRTLVTGSPNSAMATFMLYIGTSVSTTIATYLPDAFNSGLMTLTDWLNKAISGGIPGSFVSILISLFSMIAAWLIGFKIKFKPNNETLIAIACTILTRIGLAFESRVKQLDEASENVGFKQASKGIFSEAKTKFGEVKDNVVRDVSGVARTYTNKGKESAMATMDGFFEGSKDGAKHLNPIAAVGGAFVGAGVGAKSAYNNATEVGKSGKEIHSNTKDSINKSPTMNKLKKGSKENGSNDFDNRDNMKRKAKDRMKNANIHDIDRRKPIGNQLTVPVDNPKGNYSYAERKLRTFKASQSAAYAYDKDGKPYFTQNEVRHLQDTEDVGEYTQHLKETSNGNAYAYDSESARIMLEDTEFVDENGEVDVAKVNQFEEDLERKIATGEATEEDMQQKSIIDSAFVSGAKEKFVESNENASEIDNGYTTPSSSKTTVNSSSLPPREQRYTMPDYNDKQSIEKARAERPGTTPEIERPSTKSSTQPGATSETGRPSTKASAQPGKTPKTERPSTQSEPKSKVATSEVSKSNSKETPKPKSEIKEMAKDEVKKEVTNSAISIGVEATTGIDSQSTKSALDMKDDAKDINDLSKGMDNGNEFVDPNSKPKPKKRY